MKRITSPGSMHDTGCLGLVHWDDPEGWYGEGGGFRMGNTCIPVADSCLYMAKPIQYCKVKKKKTVRKKKKNKTLPLYHILNSFQTLQYKAGHNLPTTSPI